MFGSQALETAIGLAVLFFLLATATSAAVEALSKALKWRHKQLESVIKQMVSGDDSDDSHVTSVLNPLKDTSVYKAINAAAGSAGASYVSAKSFADAAVELARKAESVPEGLRDRLNNLTVDVGEDLVAVKAGLEHWFDDAMEALESRYKKWATTWLFVIGLAIAVATNSSAVNVAVDLWNDTTTRDAVVAAAEGVSSAGADAAAITDVANTTEALTQLRLPVGWTGLAPGGVDWWVSHVAGWLATAALLMLGAPFWFDLLGKLVSLRTSGRSPATAANTEASATRMLAQHGFGGPTVIPATFAQTGTGGLSAQAAAVVGRT